jgi:hypothetical protein
MDKLMRCIHHFKGCLPYRTKALNIKFSEIYIG